MGMMSPARVLVVEDDDYVRRFEIAVLKRLGYETVEAANAWQALFHLQQPFDLVILDLRMPYDDIQGSTLIDTMSKLGKEIPLIIFSGFVEDLNREELPSFVKAVLEKPISLEEFSNTVSSILEEKANI